MKEIKKLSLITLITICSILAIYRINTVRENEIAWDVLGYYLYLPATFVHHDPMLNDISWLKRVNAERNLAGTLYMVSSNDKGEPMYFLLMGMAFFYLPFFFLGGIVSSLLGLPADGFSFPYQYCLVIGGILYTIIGLVFFRKILLRYFSENITAIVMLIMVFGTNYINHLTVDNLATVNVIFMLTTIIIWNTIKWHENQQAKYLITTGVSIALVALVKPSEIFVLLLPLLWGVTSIKEFKQKISLVFSNKTAVWITLGICLLLALPQMIYWYLKTGSFIYDSYKNPGVGLDFLSPHILNTLFSYRKGWLLYTPVVIFPLIGFYFMYKNNRQIFFASLIYFLVCFYIISSWSEWWYGAAFSIRPLIATYPILGICFGYFLVELKKKNLLVKISFGAIVLFFVFLNQFQWWQYKNWILDPYRTTKEYYWATFLKTSASDADKELLTVYRDFTGKMELTNEEKYQKALLFTDDFEGSTTKEIQKENNNAFYRLTAEQEYYPIFESTFNELTSQDHVWLKASMDIRFPKGFEGTFPCLVMTMERREGSYAYHAPEIKIDSASTDNWKTVKLTYLTPDIRSTNDRFKCYVWKRGKSQFDIDNIKIEIYRKK